MYQYNELVACAPPALRETWQFQHVTAPGEGCAVEHFIRPSLTEAESVYLFELWAAKGLSVDEECASRNLAGDTPLLRAVERGKLAVVQTLLKLGAKATLRVRDMAMRRFLASQRENSPNTECTAAAILFAVVL
jgi:hypothetical protein